MTNELIFNVGDLVVYPAHGVGEIIGEENQLIGGMEIKVYIISLIREKMILRVPVRRAKAVGLRPLSSVDTFREVFDIFQAKARTSKGMWSKRAQEYETKINSGNIASLAEVVRDLYKNCDDPDRSYSERVIFEAALNRLAGEYAAIKGIAMDAAINMLTSTLEDRIFAA